MATIDEAAAFFTAFFDAEFKAIEANHAGASSFARRHKAMQSMLADNTVYEIPRLDLALITDDWRAAHEATKKALASRRLFVVEQHRIGRRKLYCAYASAPRAASKRGVIGYEMKFWADNTPRIIATYVMCGSCDGFGKLGTKPCRDCHHKGWRWQSGDTLQPTKPSDIKKIARPTMPRSAEHYDQLREGAGDVRR